jgi:hypothetical protein
MIRLLRVRGTPRTFSTASPSRPAAAHQLTRAIKVKVHLIGAYDIASSV